MQSCVFFIYMYLIYNFVHKMSNHFEHKRRSERIVVIAYS